LSGATRFIVGGFFCVWAGNPSVLISDGLRGLGILLAALYDRFSLEGGRD
jgi:hypothetical protein